MRGIIGPRYRRPFWASRAAVFAADVAICALVRRVLRHYRGLSSQGARTRYARGAGEKVRRLQQNYMFTYCKQRRHTAHDRHYPTPPMMLSSSWEALGSSPRVGHVPTPPGRAVDVGYGAPLLEQWIHL